MPMRALSGRSTLHPGSLPVIFLLIAALLLPVYAPWLNPAYAAAQPNHRHIYLGGVDYDHHVRTPAPHRHLDSKPEAPVSEPQAGSGVIMLPDQDAGGQVSPVLPHAADLTSWIEQNGRGTLSFAMSAAYVGVMLVFLSRPVPPPRPLSP